MGALTSKTLADLRRRRLQTAVLAVVLFLASGAATLALSVLDASRAPFEHAFANANGAHLVIDYAGPVDDAQLAATTTTDPVTASTGPWPVGVAGLGLPGAWPMDGLTVSGRGSPDGPIDRMTINAGRWWRQPGEATISQETALILGLDVGGSIDVHPSRAANGSPAAGSGGPRPLPIDKGSQSPPGPARTLTVVGIAASVSTPDVAAWISPEDIATLAPDAPPAREMLYRVDPSTTPADLGAETAEITAGLPSGAVIVATTYLDTRATMSQVVDLYVPVLFAFALFALLAATFTIGNVVSGVVLTGRRDIGVMKAIGFTPGQVTATLMGQILVPVAIGTGAGVSIGVLASQPTVERTARSFGLPGTFSVSIPILVAVGLACLAVTFVAAAVPAVRAGRLSVVGAITHGTAQASRPDGGRLRRLGLRLPAGIAARLGVAAGVAHPGRACMTLGALLVGVAAVTFAIGTNLSLIRAVSQLDRDQASPVRVELVDPSIEPQTVTDLIAGQPATDRFVSIGVASASVRTLGVIPFVGYQGEANWIGYEVIHGRWFADAGEAVASTSVFSRAGLRVGDTIDLAHGGRSASVRLVGEIFDSAEESPDRLVIRGTWGDLVAIDPSAVPGRWEVRPIDGVSAPEYSRTLQTAAGFGIAAYTLDASSEDEEFLLFLSVVAFMGMVLVAISVGGVFNTVLLETRQRTRETAVLKAVGLTPAQVVVMVVSSVAPVGLLAGLLGVPLGLAFQRAVITYLGQTAVQTAIPDSTFDVLGPLLLSGLLLSGLVIATVGAYAPAQRAARARVAPVLQAE
jgi:putative ABC transport system permease protein